MLLSVFIHGFTHFKILVDYTVYYLLNIQRSATFYMQLSYTIFFLKHKIGLNFTLLSTEIYHLKLEVAYFLLSSFECECSGYVAEVRKRDKKICWPFALDESHNKLEEQTCILPPLDVPKFRWWHCQNCLQEIGTKASEKEIATVPSCNNTVYKSNGTCLHMTSRGAETVLLLDYPRALNVDISEGRKVDASTSGNVNDNEHHVSLCSDKQDKQAEVACSIIIGMLQLNLLFKHLIEHTSVFDPFILFLQVMRIAQKKMQIRLFLNHLVVQQK